MDISLTIKGLREKAGLTQKELSDKCGLAQSAIARYESIGNNSITFKNLIAILDVLDCKIKIIKRKDIMGTNYLPIYKESINGLIDGSKKTLDENEFAFALGVILKYLINISNESKMGVGPSMERYLRHEKWSSLQREIASQIKAHLFKIDSDKFTILSSFVLVFEPGSPIKELHPIIWAGYMVGDDFHL